LREMEDWRQHAGQVRSLKVFSLAMIYASAGDPQMRLSGLGLNVVLQQLQVFAPLLVILIPKKRIGHWHDELVHHPAAWGPGGRLLEKAAQGVLRCDREANHFHVLELVLLVEKGFQLHLQQAGFLGRFFSGNNKEKLF